MTTQGSPFVRALAYARRHRMFAPGERVLVGVSGAASFGLLGFLSRAANELGIAEVAVASVERTTDEGSDAAEEVAEAGRLVRQCGFTFHGIRPAVTPGARVRVVKELLALAREHGFHRVALGHTRDDDALTVLRQIASGGGLGSVTGLAPRLRNGVVRPLLSLASAEACSLATIIPPSLLPEALDSRSNLRFHLEGQVMPRLRALVPEVDEALARIGRDARKSRRSLRSTAINHPLWRSRGYLDP